MDFLETFDFCAACGIPVSKFSERLGEPAGLQEKTRTKRCSPRRMDGEADEVLLWPLGGLAFCQSLPHTPLAHFVNGTMIEIDGGQEKSLMDRARDR